MSGSARSRPPRAKAHADHAKERAAAQTRHPDFEALAESWNRVVVGELAQKPGAIDIDIDWEEIRKSAGDEQGFKDFAVLLAGRLGIGLDLSKAPSLHSNHIKGLAVDMVIDGWKGATVEVADVNGNKIPTKGVEDLGKVGDTYEVHHFPTRGEPYHWSVDSH